MGRSVVRLLVIGGLICALVAAWVMRSILVVVRNVGDAPLLRATVYVTGNPYALGTLARGARRRVFVRARGESHIEIEREASSGQRRRLFVGTYFEAGYVGRIAIDITDDAIVSVDEDLHPL